MIGDNTEPTKALQALHWLQVADRIKFKIALPAHEALSTGLSSRQCPLPALPFETFVVGDIELSKNSYSEKF